MYCIFFLYFLLLISHILSYFFLLISHACSTAKEYANTLLRDSKWSKSTYAYIKCCAMCMMSLGRNEKRELKEDME